MLKNTEEKPIKPDEELSSGTDSESNDSASQLKDTDASQFVQNTCDIGDCSFKIKMSRSETKARKALFKLGLKPVRCVKRVVLVNSERNYFVIAKPDVYKYPNSDTYIVFGEVTMDDPKPCHPTGPIFLPPAISDTESEDEEVDDSGVEAVDIELVMSQVNVSKSRTVTALRNNDNDIIDAILELTI